MAVTNRERVEKALDLLKAGLGPFVDREVKNAIKAKRLDEYGFHHFHDDPKLKGKPVADWDVSALFKLMLDTWNDVFRQTLGNSDRSLVFEMRDWRNDWAHQERFNSDDTDRALDSAERLLTAVSASQADEVNRMKMELRRLVMDEQVRGEKRRVVGTLIESAGAGALKPWREVAMPHADVATGGYQQAEFAADLWQVHLGEGSDEYRDPREFFRRTYLTESLRRLLEGAARRLAGKGSDPVVQLQTNFGGGKTHSMLALYHLFSGIAPGKLEGMDEVLAGTAVDTPRPYGAWCLLATASPLAIRWKNRTGPWCALYGANSRTSLAGGMRSNGSVPTTKRRPIPVIRCANYSTSTDLAWYSSTSGCRTRDNSTMKVICLPARSRRSSLLRRRSRSQSNSRATVCL